MRVLIDALPLLGRASIGPYLRHLVNAMVAAEDHDYRLLFRAPGRRTRQRVATFVREDPLGKLPCRRTRLPNRLLEALWTVRSVHVPGTDAWLGRPDVFLATVHLNPVLRHAALVSIIYDLIPLRFPEMYAEDEPLLPRRLRRATERADAILTISRFSRRECIELLGADPERVHVVYPGVDPVFRPDDDPEPTRRILDALGIRRPYLLYVGVLAPHKNVATLVRVFRELRRRHGVPHSLVLAGNKKWGAGVLDEARDLIEGGSCRALGFVSQPQLVALYRGAEAFVTLSLSEGFGLPPAEAMACGTPVVCSDAGALPEVVGDVGLTVPPRDGAAARRALVRLIEDPELRESMATRGPRRAARFDWPTAARETLEVLRRATDSRN